ncbi:MAG: orotidine-5'-phosphate decarboxylase [Dehalococcoidia bacterium]|nr:orotidine-5'-phosphate decarboxylase [Dehalococcoidia bacterium]MDD5493665.1 orotidine-5'-phosphate decarboxylase [Dehalococcoidia bacterium]
MKFIDKLLIAGKKNKSLLCVGLDPDPQRLPIKDVLDFNKQIIDATADLVCAYKPNLAFYEAMGVKGMQILKKTVAHMPREIPVIGDAKRGDIGNTAAAYAKALFDYYKFDAVTVNPYLGYDSIEPFLNYKTRGVFILCRTSNKSAVDFQDTVDNFGMKFYESVALKAGEWNNHDNIGLVVGATYPDELKAIREMCPRMPLLIPGIGAQGGDLELTVKYGIDANKEKAVIVAARQVLYASKDQDFAQAARRAAMELRDSINRIRGL